MQAINSLSYTACSVCKAEDGHGSSITDSSTLYNEPIGQSTPLCTLDPGESQSLTRFYESLFPNDVQLQTSRFSDLGMTKQHQKGL